MQLTTLNRARNAALAVILAAGMSIPATAVAYAADGDGSSDSSEAKDKMKRLIKDDAEDESIPKKTESVYVFAHADGSVKNTVVSSWLKNPAQADTIQDISNLTDIENTEGKETFTNESGRLVWDAGGNDIYYQGNTEQAAPVSIKVTYWLDGVQTAPDEMAGKSGHVKIRFDYTNHSQTTEYVAGAARTVYTPFVCITGMILDNDIFRNVTTKNAKAMNDGDRTMVGGYAMPGLQEDLDIDRDTIDFPDYFEVEADVTNFEMGTTATLVTSNLLDNIDADEIDSDLGDSINKLSDAMGQLIDGSSTLYDGMKLLDDGSEALADGSEELADATSELPESAKQLADGSAELADGLTQAVAAVGAEKMKDTLLYAAYSTNAGLELLKNGNAAQTGLVDAVNGVNALKAGADQLGSGIGNAKDGIAQVSAGLSAGKDKVNAIAGGLEPTMLAALGNLGTKLSGLGALSPTLTEAGTAAGTAKGHADAAKTKADGAATSANAAYEAALSTYKLVNGNAAATDEQKATAKTAYEQAAAARDAASQASSLAAQASDTSGTALTKVQSAGNALSSAADPETQHQITAAGEMLSSLDAESIKSLAEQLDVAAKTLDAIANGGTIPTTGETTAGLAGAQTGAATISAGLSQLNEGGTTADGRTSAGLSGAVSALGDTTTAGTLLYGTNATYDGVKKLRDEALTPAEAGANQLAGGLSQLNDAVPALAAGIQALKEGSAALNTGMDAATEGTKQLTEGLEQFNSEGIQKIVDAYNDNLAGLADRLKATVQAGKDYNTFSGKNDSMLGSVKFIYETDAIELPDED